MPCIQGRKIIVNTGERWKLLLSDQFVCFPCYPLWGYHMYILLIGEVVVFPRSSTRVDWCVFDCAQRALVVGTSWQASTIHKIQQAGTVLTDMFTALRTAFWSTPILSNYTTWSTLEALPSLPMYLPHAWCDHGHTTLISLILNLPRSWQKWCWHHHPPTWHPIISGTVCSTKHDRIYESLWLWVCMLVRGLDHSEDIRRPVCMLVRGLDHSEDIRRLVCMLVRGLDHSEGIRRLVCMLVRGWIKVKISEGQFVC